MTVNWIATRTQGERQSAVFNPSGIGFGPAAPSERDNQLLTRGTLLIEAQVSPCNEPVDLITFGVMEPWPVSVSLTLEPDGTVRLIMRQGARHLETVLRTSLGSKAQTAHIIFNWNAPARTGDLSVFVPDRGAVWHTRVDAPFPLALREARRIVEDPEASVLHRDVTFVAMGDRPCPLGPLPMLHGTSAVDTMTGPRALRDIRVGDYVRVSDVGAVRVLWAGQVTMPSLGRFAPMTLRRPYLGLWDDIIAARDQRACLGGSEVEYLFGEERVSTAIRHLEARNCAELRRDPPPVMTYHQILLETQDAITVNGAVMESFDASVLLDTPDLLAMSVLADLPNAVRPRRYGIGAPVLQGYEALTLTHVSVG